MTNSLIPFRFSNGLMDDVHREFDSLLQRFFQSEQGTGEPVRWVPRLNFAETESQYEVSIDLPGMKSEDIEIELKHGDLWIVGKRELAKEDAGKTWHRTERFYGEFRRVVRLGDDVDAENVSAEYRDGVLHIAVPKAETAKTKKITVKSA